MQTTSRCKAAAAQQPQQRRSVASVCARTVPLFCGTLAFGAAAAIAAGTLALASPACAQQAVGAAAGSPATAANPRVVTLDVRDARLEDAVNALTANSGLDN